MNPSDAVAANHEQHFRSPPDEGRGRAFPCVASGWVPPGAPGWRSRGKHHAARAVALAAAFTLLGCASAPPPAGTHRPHLPAAPAFELPAAAAPVPALAIDRWWQLFEDPQLEARIDAALARNADLAVASARLLEARAQLDQASGAQRPRLDIQASSGRSRVSAAAGGAADGAARIGGTHRASLVADHELDLWGRLRAGTRAARERLQAQRWARATIEWSLAAQVSEAHFALRATQAQLDIARAVRQGRMREVELRRAQREAGSGAELELRRSEAELASADASVAALLRRGLALHNTLALLTGAPLQELVAVQGLDVQPLDTKRPFEARLPRGQLAQLLIRRPDVRQAESEMLATRADVGSARAGTLPAVRLSGSVGSDVRELSNLFSGPGVAWSLLSSVVQSVFDGGRAQAQVHETEARAEAALARYQRVVAAAVLDVREAYLSFEFDDNALRAEQQRVAALARALALARTGEQAGVATQLDTLDAERNHFQARLAEVDAYRNRLLGQVAAFKALGGGHAVDGHISNDPSTAGAP